MSGRTVRLPAVLSRDGVARVRGSVLGCVLGCIREDRFLVPLRLTYLCGPRLSEVRKIEVCDIHRAEGGCMSESDP